jgi:hypothetical protein
MALPGSSADPANASNACAYGVSNKFLVSYYSISISGAGSGVDQTDD